METMAWKMMYLHQAMAQVYLQKPLAGSMALRNEVSLSSCEFRKAVTPGHGWMVYKYVSSEPKFLTLSINCGEPRDVVLDWSLQGVTYLLDMFHHS